MAAGVTLDGSSLMKFMQAAKRLANTYYPFIQSDKRSISRSVIDLQADFEVCSDTLEELERVAAEISSLHFALFGLEQALFRAVSELIIIKDEISDLLSSLKESEHFNLKLFDQLATLNISMKSGIESGQANLTKSKKIRSSLNINIERYKAPSSLKKTLECALIRPDPKLNSPSDIGNVMNDVTVDDSHIEWQVGIQRELSRRHAEFSFLILGLWTEGVYENHELNASESIGCFGMKKGNSEPEYDEVKHLKLAHKGKISDAPATLGVIESKVQELGGQIFDELERLNLLLARTRREHSDLTQELAERRRQLIDTLMATHKAVQTLLDMDEQNDALVGKLIKTRPMFAELHRALIKGELETDDNVDGSENYKLLPEVLGSDGWSQLVENLEEVKLPRNNNASNSVEIDDAFFSRSVSSKLFLNARRSYLSTKSNIFKKHFH